MAIFDFIRKAGQKVLGKGGSGGGSRAASGSGKQQQQFSGGASGQQQSSGGTARSGGAPGSGSSSSSARGSGSTPGSSAGSTPGSSAGGSPGSGAAQAGGKSGSQSMAATAPGNIDQAGSDAIRDHIMSMDDVDAPDDLVILFDADEGTVIIEGTVDDDDTAELIVLVAGNIEGVEHVDDRMTNSVAGEHGSGSRTASRFHTVGEGETLSSLARQYYSDENQSGRIADANRPVMGDKDEVSSGQTLRIPQEGSGSGSASSSKGAGMSGKTTH
jgi:osmotically-inducible protein OsmY